MDDAEKGVVTGVDTMLDFFRGLSDRDKALISAFDYYVTATDSGRAQQAVRDIVDNFDPTKVPAECQFLLGVIVAAKGIMSAE